MQYIGSILGLVREWDRFFQTHPSAIILCDTFLPIRLERAVSMKTQEVFYIQLTRGRNVLCQRLLLKLIDKRIGILMQQQAAATPNQTNWQERDNLYF